MSCWAYALPVLQRKQGSILRLHRNRSSPGGEAEDYRRQLFEEKGNDMHKCISIVARRSLGLHD